MFLGTLSLVSTHPVSPDSLHFHRFEKLFTQLGVLRSLIWARVIPSQAPQSSRPPGAFAIFQIIIVEAIFSVIDGCGASFGGATSRDL
jgi:hypothetical protein